MTTYDGYVDGTQVIWPSWGAGTFNPRAFGAKGDGVTDDSAAFLAAVAAANAQSAAGGATVSVPPGTYVLNTAQLVVASNVELQLAKGATLLRPATSGLTGPMVILNGNGAKLSGGKVQCLTASPVGIVVVGNTTDTVFSRAAMTVNVSTGNILTAESSVFTAGMVGWVVSVDGAGVAGARLLSSIITYTSATQVTLNDFCSTTVSHVRALAGTGGTNINWAIVNQTQVWGRNSLGSGDVGVKFNGYPQATSFGTYQNQVLSSLVRNVDYGVVYGPGANANTVDDGEFYGIGVTPILFNNADECLCHGGFVSQSSNVTMATVVGSIYDIVSDFMGEPGGGSAHSFNLDADTSHCTIRVNANTALGGTDSGVANTTINTATDNLISERNAHLIIPTGPSNTGLAVAAGAAMGTSPPAPTIAGTDSLGVISFGSGSAPSTGTLLTVTFARSWTVAPVVMLTQGPLSATNRDFSVAVVSGSGFTVDVGTALAASQPAGTYSINYLVAGAVA